MFQKRKATDFLVVHCSATPPSHNWGRADIDRSHRNRGFIAIGYHFVIKRDGTVETGRPVDTQGAHVEGYNSRSIGICMIGGVKQGDLNAIENNFTPAQFDALAVLLARLKSDYPKARVLGHRDLSPDKNRDGKITPNEWLKGCPSFSVADFLKSRGL